MLEEALNDALAALRILGLLFPDQGEADKGSGSAGTIPPEMCATLAKRLREAADIGDIAGLNAIADELLPQGDVFEALSRRISQLAGDFDFDGVVALAASLEDPEGAPQ